MAEWTEVLGPQAVKAMYKCSKILLIIPVWEYKIMYGDQVLIHSDSFRKSSMMSIVNHWTR